MNRLAVLLLVLGGCTCDRPPAAPEAEPEAAERTPAPTHVVLISIDTLRAKSLRAYSETAPPRPALDRLAERGHVFERAYSTAAWTLPSHVSLFTGLYPRHHGVVDHRQAMGDVSTFVQTLRDAGYQTIGFADGGYLSGGYGFSRGFEVYDDWRDEGVAFPMESLPRGGERSFDTKQNMLDRASAFLRARTDERPLFLFVQSFAVHDYFRSWLPAEKDENPLPTPDSRAQLECLLGKAKCSPQRWKELEASYEAGIDSFDRALGDFLALVERVLGVEHTFIAILSDHGEGFDHARSRIHHGGRLHRDQLHVPLIVAGPGIDPGRSQVPVSLVDLRASLLELIGVTEEVEHDGRSFAPALFGRPIAPRDGVWASEYYHYWQRGRRHNVLIPLEEPLATAWIGDRRWYIQSTTGEELYDVRDEPQNEPLAGEIPKHVEQPPRSRRAHPAKVEQDEKLIEQLRALGYVE